MTVKTEPKYRRPLNTEQVQILELLYKFRFATMAVVKDYFVETNPGMNVFRRLETLADQGFIAKRYFDNYRLLHKPVVYYLLPAGARKLKEYRDEDDTDEINIKGIYRDGDVSEQFVMHSVAALNLYNRLVAEYGDDLDFFSKADQASFDNFPKPLPDAYLTLQADGGAQHYFVEILDDDAHLLVDVSKKIKRFIDYKKSGSWALVARAPFPKIIFVCASETFCKRAQKRCEAALDKAWVMDITVEAVTSDHITLS